MPKASSLGWSPLEQIHVAHDVEAMTELVDGAAEILWEKGVRKMASQSFGGSWSGGSGEALRYEFDDQDSARDFWEENCPGAAVKSTGSDDTRSGFCERSDPSVSQAFFWTARVVLEVRLYGDAANRDALLRLLEQEFKNTSGSAGSERSFAP